MNIVFVYLPKYLDFISIFLAKLNFRVFYISLAGDYKPITNIDRKRAEKLKKYGILPAPNDEVKNIDFPDYAPGIYKKFRDRAYQILDKQLIENFSRFFNSDKNFEKKIYNHLISSLYLIFFPQMARATIPYTKSSDQKALIICLSFKYFYIKKCIKIKNIRIIILPINDFLKIVKITFGAIIKIFRKKNTLNKKNVNENTENEFLNEKVALIIHQRTIHGKLYKKDPYYSKKENSFLNEKKLLHIDYSNINDPPSDTKWLNLKNITVSKKTIIGKITKLFFNTFYFLLSPKKFLGCLFLFYNYVEYIIYYEKLKKLKKLKLALIDYDILCPKTLLLALESLSIKTLCAQNRYSHPLLNAHNFFYDYYLCSSEFIKEKIKNSERNLVKNLFTVGQCRTDNFHYNGGIKKLRNYYLSKVESKKLVTCLGFHTEVDWFNAKTCFLINWNAHKYFLKDIINLAKKFPDTHFILRYKLINWMKIDFFRDILLEIDMIKNIQISQDYSKYNISYDLCSGSDLVIAKTTSLADECLAYGIPVLIHDYSYNLNTIISNVLDYKPLDIVCKNFEELEQKTKKILNIPKNEFQYNNQAAIQKYFLKANKPDVKNKIQSFIENIYENLNEAN